MEGLGDGYEFFVERLHMEIAASSTSSKPSHSSLSSHLPPHQNPSTYDGYPSATNFNNNNNNAFMMKKETPSTSLLSITSSSERGGGGGNSSMNIMEDSSVCFPFSTEVNLMPDAPPRRGTHHRRAQSETALWLPDDLLFEPTDLGFLGDSDIAMASDEYIGDDFMAMYLDIDHSRNSLLAPTTNIDTTTAAATTTTTNNNDGGFESDPFPKALGPMTTAITTNSPINGMPPDIRSVDRSITRNGSIGSSSGEGGGVGPLTNSHPRHRHSYSMDASTSLKQEFLFGDQQSIDSKRALATKKLAEISMVDPKKAKRIIANRQSAARSKERKTRYIAELEHKVQTLQTEATTLSAHLTLLQRDTTSLTSENNELRVRLQSYEQQAQLRDALNDTLKEEVQRLKFATAQLSVSNGQTFNHVPNTKQFAQYSHQLPTQEISVPSNSNFTPSDYSGSLRGKSGSFGSY